MNFNLFYSTNLQSLSAPFIQPGLSLLSFVSTHATGEEKLTKFLRERVFSKNILLYAPVPLNKRLTFARMSITGKHGEKLAAGAADVQRIASKAVIDLVKASHLVSFAELLEHRVVEECKIIFNSMAHTARGRKACLFRNDIYYL